MASKEVVFDLDAQAFASDEFRIYQFKVKRCPRSRPHDWTQCPFAHPGEKAKRRDPRRYRYSGTACPEFRRNGCCRRGDACPFAHGVFECWLHPSRYRTQMCTDGNSCKRRVCFFAHCEVELRKPEEDPVWLQQQLQAELAAEQHQHQQQQAISILAALLGTQKSGTDSTTPVPANLASQPLASLLGLQSAGSGAGAPSALPHASSDTQKAADVMGSLQQGNSGLTLLSLIDLLQKQQTTPQAASALLGAPPPQLAPSSSTAASAAASDEGLQAQLAKLLLGGGAATASSRAPPAPAPAPSSKPRDIDAEVPETKEPSAAPTPSAPLDVLSLLTSLAAPRSPSQAANPNVVSAMQQLLQPTLEPTSLLAALLSSKPTSADGGAPSVQASLAALLQQVAAAAPQAAATKPTTATPVHDNGAVAPPSEAAPAAAPKEAAAQVESSSPGDKAAPGAAAAVEPAATPAATAAESSNSADMAKP